VYFELLVDNFFYNSLAFGNDKILIEAPGPSSKNRKGQDQLPEGGDGMCSLIVSTDDESHSSDVKKKARK